MLAPVSTDIPSTAAAHGHFSPCVQNRLQQAFGSRECFITPVTLHPERWVRRVTKLLPATAMS